MTDTAQQIAEIEKANAHRQTLYFDSTLADEAVADCATLLALIRRPVCDREALAKWVEDHFVSAHIPASNGIRTYVAYDIADALLSSGIIVKMPAKEELASVLIGHGTGRDGERLRAVDAILAQFK